jgi:hypothetical protein
MPLDQYAVLVETPVTRSLSALYRGQNGRRGAGGRPGRERTFCRQVLFASMLFPVGHTGSIRIGARCVDALQDDIVADTDELATCLHDDMEASV